MLLLIDAGNTRIKWAIAAPGTPVGAWQASGAVMNADLPQLTAKWQAGAAQAPITRAIIANVAGPAMRTKLEALIAARDVQWFASLPAAAGVRNAYREPSQLGCDRFAAAIGARALAPGKALIVATCGTATTIDAIDANGVFIGGMIVPGLGLMAAALARNTAQLPQIAADLPLPGGFADNTDDAIASGCLAAQAGAIERAVALHGGAECIISGGAARFIAPTLSVPHRLIDNIVLIGLHATATTSG